MNDNLSFQPVQSHLLAKATTNFSKTTSVLPVNKSRIVLSQLNSEIGPNRSDKLGLTQIENLTKSKQKYKQAQDFFESLTIQFNSLKIQVEELEKQEQELNELYAEKTREALTNRRTVFGSSLLDEAQRIEIQLVKIIEPLERSRPKMAELELQCKIAAEKLDEARFELMISQKKHDKWVARSQKPISSPEQEVISRGEEKSSRSNKKYDGQDKDLQTILDSFVNNNMNPDTNEIRKQDIWQSKQELESIATSSNFSEHPAIPKREGRMFTGQDNVESLKMDTSMMNEVRAQQSTEFPEIETFKRNAREPPILANKKTSQSKILYQKLEKLREELAIKAQNAKDNPFLNVSEDEMQIDDKKLSEVEKLRKLKSIYDQAALEYNQAQVKSADISSEIDKFQAQIKESERLRDKALKRVEEFSLEIQTATNTSDRKTAIKKKKAEEKSAKKLGKRLKKLREKLARMVKFALDAEDQLDQANFSVEEAEKVFLPYEEALTQGEKDLSDERASIKEAIDFQISLGELKEIENEYNQAQKHESFKRGNLKARVLKRIDKEISLLKKEKIKQAQKDGRMLDLQELEQWAEIERNSKKAEILQNLGLAGYDQKENIKGNLNTDQVPTYSNKLVEGKIDESDMLDSKPIHGDLTPEKVMRKSGVAGPDGISYRGAWPIDTVKKEFSIRSKEQSDKKYDINVVVVTGDREIVYELANWPKYENEALYAPMSLADIEVFRQRLLLDLREDGYVFSTVSVYKNSLNFGFLKFRVHVGDKGNVTVVGNRWHTAKQILNAASWKTGEQFNYRKLYDQLFNINTSPDVRVDTKLVPTVDKKGRRIIDLELNVIDRVPIHGSINLNNSGVKETSDWRLRSTIQDLNLTRRKDILTLEWLTDPKDLQNVNAFSGSYFLPTQKNSSYTLFGGWSESEITDVAPEIDVFGEGYYMGMQYSKVLKSNEDYTFDASISWFLQSVDNFNKISGQTDTNSLRDIDLSMPSLTIGYSAKKFDDLGGKNYIANTIQANFAGKFSSSNEDKFGDPSTGLDGDFVFDRFQFARFQKLYSGENEPGKWTLFLRFDAQITNNSLISAVQKGFGGVNSIRGYQEREVSADSGFTGSLELRTPLISNFVPVLETSEEYQRNNPEDWKVHRLQFVSFLDFGRSDQNEPLLGEEKSELFSSIGAGMRVALTKFSQFRLDLALPLDKTDESDTIRGHFSVQGQF